MVHEERAAPRPDTADPDEGRHRIRHVSALDGVRGVAVAAVLLYHGDALPGGFLGVDAFFVLSGFLITSLLLAEAGASYRVRLGEFWVRRARRLLPALFLMLLGVCLYAQLLASPGDLDRIRGDALSTLFYFANWHSIVANHGYWSLFQSPSPLEHTWSLAIEEQFYLVWPLVVLGTVALARRWSRRRVGSATAAGMLGVSVGLGVASTTWMWVSYRAGTDPSRLYFGTDTRAASILVGAALAAWLAWKGPTRRVERRVGLEVAALAAIVFLGFEWARASGTAAFLYHGGFLACGLAVAVVIAAASHPRQGIVARALAVRPLVALGVISYGVYLWHWPIYVAMTKHSTGLDGAALLTTRIAVTLAVATASFVLVERPIRTGHYPRRRLAIGVPAAATACALTIILSTTGATTTAASASAATAFTSTGASKTSAAARAAASATARGTRMLVVGDSVGVNIGDAAHTLQTGSGLAVDNASISGCLLAPSSDTFEATLSTGNRPIPSFTPCEAAWLDNVRLFKPAVVAMIYGTGASFLEPSIGGQFVSSCSNAYRSWYTAHLRVTIAQFTKLGVRRVLLFKLPHVENENWPDDAAARIDCVNAIHEQVARRIPGVVVLDLADEVCPATRCRPSFAGVPFRFDGIHVTEGAPALLVGRWLLDETSRLLA